MHFRLRESERRRDMEGARDGEIWRGRETERYGGGERRLLPEAPPRVPSAARVAGG